MKEIQLAVFDMAGTTVNENNVVYKTVRKSLIKAGYDLSLEMVLEHGAGKEKKEAIAHLLSLLINKQADPKTIDEIFEDFKAELESAYNSLEVNTYEGVEGLFEYLRNKGIKVVLNTGYDKHTAKKLLQKLGWSVGQQIDGFITADDVKLNRPSPEMIELAMDRFSIEDASKVIKVGDSTIDIEEGMNAKCGMTVGVLTGAQNRKQLETANPTMILDSVAALRNIL